MSKRIKRILYPLMALSMTAPLMMAGMNANLTNASAKRYRYRYHRYGHYRYRPYQQRSYRYSPRFQRFGSYNRFNRYRFYGARHPNSTHQPWKGLPRTVTLIAPEFDPSQKTINGTPGAYRLHLVRFSTRQLANGRARQQMDKFLATPQNIQRAKQTVDTANHNLDSKRSEHFDSSAQQETPHVQQAMANPTLVPGENPSNNQMTQPTPQNTDKVHIHQSHAITMLALANMYKVSPSRMRSLNPGLSLNHPLKRGTTVNIPRHHGNQVSRSSLRAQKLSLPMYLEFDANLPRKDYYGKRHIVLHESGFRWFIKNPSSSARGRFQLKPYNMIGHSWRTRMKPVNQEKAANRYVHGRYGNWSHAWRFWRHWHSY